MNAKIERTGHIELTLMVMGEGTLEESEVLKLAAAWVSKSPIGLNLNLNMDRPELDWGSVNECCATYTGYVR